MKNGHTSGRRAFIKNAAKAGLAAAFVSPALTSLASEKPPSVVGNDYGDINWTQQALEYNYNAIEPAIDATTMEIHYSKHAATYVKNLTEAVKEEKVNTTSTTIEQLLKDISKYSPKMRNNAGGHYNHELFWKSLKASAGSNNPTDKLADLITKDFGSFETFKNQFSETAKNRFGSGWAWLIYTGDKKLVISSTPNQDNPLMSVAEVKGMPVLGLDIWEHAYYLKYQNKRPDYINAWWTVVNWDYVQKRFSASRPTGL